MKVLRFGAASGSGCGSVPCLPGLPLLALVVISAGSALTERRSESKAITPDWSPFPRRGCNRCRRPIAKTSYGGHGRAAPQHWSAWWMSDPNQSSRAFTSFEFMHGEACQGRGMMWTLLCLFASRFRPPIPRHCLKPVICCLLLLCQNAADSRFNVCRLTGRKAISFKGVKSPSTFNPPSIILISSGFRRKLNWTW